MLNEEDALRLAMAEAQPGDLLVMFYEKFDQAYEIIRQHLPASLSSGDSYSSRLVLSEQPAETFCSLIQ